MRRMQGFTLLEVLLALFVAALVLAAATGSLRLGAQAWRVGIEAGDRAEDQQLWAAWLQRQLAAARPVPFEPMVAPARRSYFEGRHDRMEFVAPLAARHAVPGLRRITIETVPADGGVDLVLQYPLWGQPHAVDPGDRRTLNGRPLAHVEFGYFGRLEPGGQRGWQQHWPGRPFLPEAVRVAWRAEGDTAPTVVLVPLRAEGGLRPDWAEARP